MNGFDTYKLFLALNNHFFQGSYDYFKYAGNVTIKSETYNDKKSFEKYRYETLGRKFKDKEDAENFIVANLLEAKKRTWIGSMAGPQPEDVYLKWQARVQSLQYNLTNQLSKLLENNFKFNSLFKCEESQHPEILKAYMREELSLESFVILDMCLGFIERLDKKIGEDRNWMLVKRKSEKYKPFLERLNIDVQNIKKVICKVVQDME